MNATLHLEPCTGTIGALVTDVSLAEPLSDDQFNALNEALLEYEVLFFRDQPMPHEAFAAFADRFGKAQPHGAYPHVPGFPQLTILENDRDNPSKIELWHTDMTFLARPPLGSILQAIVVPDRGGDTLFASLSAAYDGLSTAMQEFLGTLTAVHDFRHGFRESLAEPGGEERLADMVAANPPVRHPVVRTHPVSGKKALFVNPLFTVRIEGLSRNESRSLLEFLYDHITTPEYTCRFKWQPNSIAFWDNRITQHKPVNDYWPQHRLMQRITIEGDQPV